MSLSPTTATYTLDSLPAPCSREAPGASVTHSHPTPPEHSMRQSPDTSSGPSCRPNSPATTVSMDSLRSQGTSLIESSAEAPYRKPVPFTGQENSSEEVYQAAPDLTLPASRHDRPDDAYQTDETHPVRQSSSEFSSDLSEETENLYGNMKEFPLPDGLLQDSKARVFSGMHLGENAIIEARKGLSRVLNTTDLDLDKFRRQLRHCKQKAYEENYMSWRDDKVPCFALSYVQHSNDEQSENRDKFNDEQWENLRNMIRVFARNGIKQVRLWLDQCLWLRDASQESWVHIGLLPYVLWPVISLGTKRKGEERTISTSERVWPFLEELGGLWSLGVLITRETRDTDKAESRVWISHNVRHRFEPEESMIIMFLNIFHGALDNLKTGWTRDVKELKEMARWNILCDTEELQIGSGWTEDLMGKQLRPVEDMFKCICMPTGRRKDNQLTAYLESARKVDSESRKWNGIHEWMSDNTRGILDKNNYSSDLQKIQNGMIKLNIVRDDEEEYQMLRYSMPGFSVWLLVCMDGRSSNFCRGRVAWTKVMQSEATLHLDMSLSGYLESTDGPGATQLNTLVIKKVLAQQLGTDLTGNVIKAEVWQGEIAWQ